MFISQELLKNTKQTKKYFVLDAEKRTVKLPAVITTN